jgi:hypothetical protein
LWPLLSAIEAIELCRPSRLRAYSVGGRARASLLYVPALFGVVAVWRRLVVSAPAMHRGGTWHDGNQQPLLLHGPPEERLVAEGVGKTIGVRETSGPQLSPGQWQTKTATVAANKAQVTTTTAGHHDMTCLQSTFGSTDAWCQPLWWPMRRHHIPRAGFWWWVVVLLAFAAGPVAICLFFTVGSRGNYSLAERLVDAGYLVWLLLIGIVFSDTLKALHPLHGCAATLPDARLRGASLPELSRALCDG